MAAEILTSTKDMPREEWLEHRRSGIGGSDAAAVLGINRWKSPMSLFLDKTGQIEDQPAGERAYWGQVLEDVVAREFMKRSGKTVRKRNFMFRDPVYPFMIADIDREVVGENAGLECKTTSEWNASQWEGDSVPDIYFCQCQHYCRVMGWDGVYIAVLAGFGAFLWKYIPRDEDFISLLIAREKEFWMGHVEKNFPPAWDGSSASEEVLTRLHPEANGTEILLPEGETNDLAEEYKKLHAQVKELETIRDAYKQRLQSMLGSAERGSTLSWDILWKNTSRTDIDSKRLKAEEPALYERFLRTSVYRRFDVKKIKED